MKIKSVILGLIYLFPCSIVFGQKEMIRLPFRVGDKYTIIDENGKEIITPEFENVKIYSDFKILMLKKNGLWGAFNFDGTKLLDHTISDNVKVLELKEIERVQNGNHRDSKVFTSRLIAIYDNVTNVKYYINPYHPLKKYKPYSTIIYSGINIYEKDFLDQNNRFLVVNIDKTINIIDSIGREVFNEPLEGAEVISNKIIAVKKGDKFAIFNGNKMITGFEYDQYLKLNDGYGFFLRKTNYKADYKKQTLYTFFDSDGVKIDSSYRSIEKAHDYILINRDTGFVLLNEKGNRLFTHEKYNGLLFKSGNQVYIKTLFGDKSGLMKCDGIEIYPTTCVVTNHYSQKLISINFGNGIELVDSILNPVFKLKNVESCYPLDYTDYFVVGIKDGWQQKIGLLDKNQKYILEPNYRQIRTLNCKDFVLLQNDSINIVSRLENIKPLLKFSKDWRVDVDCKAERISALKDENSIKIFSFEGKELFSGNSRDARKKPSINDNKYKISIVNNKYNLEDENCKKVLPESYQEVVPIKDESGKKSIYICEFNVKSFPNTKTYGDNLNIITPAGYSVPSQWKHLNKKNPGTIIVLNDEDGIAKNHYHRIGVCDFEGNWIIKPFSGTIELVEKGLFALKNYAQKTIEFYNSTGKKTINKEIHFFFDNSQTVLSQNRILVSTLADLAFMEKVNALNMDKLDFDKMTQGKMEELTQKIKQIGEPEMLYGFLDATGQKVLDFKYVKAKHFQKNSDKTFVSLYKNNKLVSQVIDTSGKVHFEFDFDEIDYLDSLYYKAKKGGYWAIVSLDGRPLTPFKFEKINSFNRENYFAASTGENHFIIDRNFSILSLGRWYNVDIEKSNGFYIVKFMIKENDSYSIKNKFGFYSENLKELGILDDAYSISYDFNGTKLPKGFVVVSKDFQSKDKYIFDIIKNKKLQR